MEARRVNLELNYDNKDITRDVWPFVESFKYVDRTLSNKMDELSVTFQDVAGLWQNSWWPDQGSKFNAKIAVDNWFNQGDHFERDCGGFEIDDLSSSGLPSTFTISAISVGITNSITRQQNTKAWENITPKDIAEEIANKNGFQLKWFSKYNPILTRWEQKSQSDLSLLKAICEYAGLMLKITNKYIIIFRGEEFDGEKPELKVSIYGDSVKSYSFNANSSDVYSACEIKYYDSDKQELVEYLYKPDGISGVRGAKKEKEEKPKYKQMIEGNQAGEENTRQVKYVEIPQAKKPEEPEITEPEVGRVLKVNQRVSSLAEAEELAKATLRKKNMRQTQGNLTFMGRPDLYSGMNINVAGFGRWDSVIWNVEEVTHEYSRSGYSTSISIRGILGY
jgi:phage protein D